MTNDQINKIFKQFAAHYPNPKTELEYRNKFTLLVAIMMSAQTTDIAVNKVTANLFTKYNTPQQFLQLGEEGLKANIKSIGLFNTKAKNIISLCQILIDKYNEEVPSTIEELIKLPGVGRKTANVFLNCAYNKPTIAVDTHVFRVSKRIGLARSSNVLGVENELIAITPEQLRPVLHHWLVLHGKYICKARVPNCSKCFMSTNCQYFSSKTD